MDETISLLREQTILCNRFLKLFAQLSDLLKKNSLDIVETVRQIESTVMELRNNLNQTRAFLGKSGVNNFTDFLSRQKKDVKRDVAERLVKQVNSLQEQLKVAVSEANRLTKNGRKFIDFNLNVLSQTAANTTYGAGAETGSQSNRRIFDAGV